MYGVPWLLEKPNQPQNLKLRHIFDIFVLDTRDKKILVVLTSVELMFDDKTKSSCWQGWQQQWQMANHVSIGDIKCQRRWQFTVVAPPRFTYYAFTVTHQLERSDPHWEFQNIPTLPIQCVCVLGVWSREGRNNGGGTSILEIKHLITDIAQITFIHISKAGRPKSPKLFIWYLAPQPPATGHHSPATGQPQEEY